MSVRAFCRREGLSEASFYAWRRELVARDESSGSSAMGGREPAPAFVEVKVCDAPPPASPPESASVTTAAGASCLEVVTRAGLVVRVREGFDAATLRRVVEALS